MNYLAQNNLKEQRTNLTPIEIALGIDEEGRTTAKKLYEFLELEPKNYSRWCKSKIVENEFAVKNIDFIPFVINDERNPKPTTDYKLSASFAKKLAMGTDNEKGKYPKVTEAELELIRLLEKLKKRCQNERNTRVSLERKQSYMRVLKECLQECEGI